MNFARRSLSRCLTTTTNALSTADQDVTRDQLRALFRETAQPVAVVTSVLHPNPAGDSQPLYHGATLSSLTSIALNPFPLVAFSLCVPSRMATSLKTAPPDPPSHMVISILSASQASAAIAFSRPDLYREPFSSIPYHLSEDGVPILEDSLGALSCRLVLRSLPLHDLAFFEKGFPADAGKIPSGVRASELFIARVIRVENPKQSDGGNDLRTLPLLYHRRGYTSCGVRLQDVNPT